MPASSGGKQVAMVQPQRRDNGEHNDKSRGARARASPRVEPLQTTKASLWIESRKPSPKKTSPRKSVKSANPTQLRAASVGRRRTPLRTALLRRVTSHHARGKIQDPTSVDHTKQAAIMLMMRHTPKSKSPSPRSVKRSPSYVIKKPSPVRKTPRGGRKQNSKENTPNIGVTPKRLSVYAQGSATRNSRSSGKSVTILEIPDSDGYNSTAQESNISVRSGKKSPQKSPLLPSPKKSAMKDTSKKNTRKTESIKFDLSNLENESEVMSVDTSIQTSRIESDDDITLHYSDTSSNAKSPSPRRSIHSRSSRILEKTLGTTVNVSSTRTITPESTKSKKSLRGSVILKKALDNLNDTSRRTSKADHTAESIASAFKTRTLSPRSVALESYSIVDLVSVDSVESGPSTSVYSSANSTTFNTPTNGSTRNTRSTLDHNFLGSSTPYVEKVNQSSPNLPSDSQRSTRSTRSKRSKSLSTPENTHKPPIPVISARVSRRSRSRSRLNDSDLLLISGDEVENGLTSPKSSKRISRTTMSKSSPHTGNSTLNTTTGSLHTGSSTPENRNSPESVGTPVLRIQSLLNSSESSLTSQKSNNKGRRSGNRRKTIGVLTENKKGKHAPRSKSLNISVRRTILSQRDTSSSESDKTDEDAVPPDNEEVITPKSAVQLVQEPVKNKHSTAKKPQSKRYLIDELNESDIVKQLFNSPVKRNLSRSMTEFSRKRLFEDDDMEVARRPARNTVALTGRTPNNSILENSETYSPEQFISPMNTPSNSPNLSGIKRLFKKTTPADDLRDVTGVKKMFAASPRNDLRQVTGVKSLFQTQKKNKSPKNDLSDVRGVKNLFKNNSPVNDLRNVSGVRRTLRRHSPRNNLSDVRGVKKIFRQEKQKNDLNDVSGVEELFNESNQSHRDSDSLFDQLLGKPAIKAVYSNTFTKKIVKPKTQGKRTLHSSIDVIANNVEDWLQHELDKRLHKRINASASKGNKSKSSSKNSMQTLTEKESADASQMRLNTIMLSLLDARERYSASALPIKKRSLERSKDDKKRLPIKKRAIVQSTSTPVKGRAVAVDTSELGRVSPIARLSSAQQIEVVPEIKTRGRKQNKSQKQEVLLEETAPASRETRASRAKASPVVKSRRTRTTKADTSNVEQRKTTIIVTKKSPVLSPKPVQSEPSPKITRGTRKQTKAKEDTPKKTRARARRVSLVVSKPSPKLKPQRIEKVTKQTEQSRRTRKTALTNNDSESPKEFSVQYKRKTKVVENARKTRGRAEQRVVEIQPTPEKRTALRRGRKLADHTQSKTEVSEMKTRGSKTAAQEIVESLPKRQRAAKNVTQSHEAIVPEMSNKRTRITVDLPVSDETKGRKRKATISDVVPVKVAKTRAQTKVKSSRGRKVETTPKDQETNKTVRGKKAATKAMEMNSNENTTKSRGRSKKILTEEVIEVKPKRGQKVVTEQVQPKRGGRKRTNNTEISAKELSEASPLRKTRKRAVPPAPVPGTT